MLSRCIHVETPLNKETDLGNITPGVLNLPPFYLSETSGHLTLFKNSIQPDVVVNACNTSGKPRLEARKKDCICTRNDFTSTFILVIW